MKMFGQKPAAQTTQASNPSQQTTQQQQQPQMTKQNNPGVGTAVSPGYKPE